MAAVHTKDRAVSRRLLLRGLSAMGAPITVGLPPLAAMFNSVGTAYAAGKALPPNRFVLWFNGNGVVERYWIPTETGRDFTLTPCLAPLANFREDLHIVTGLDNPAEIGRAHV